MSCFKLNPTCHKFYKLVRINFSYYLLLESLKAPSEKIDVSKFLFKLLVLEYICAALAAEHMLLFSRIIGRKRISCEIAEILHYSVQKRRRTSIDSRLI